MMKFQKMSGAGAEVDAGGDRKRGIDYNDALIEEYWSR